MTTPRGRGPTIHSTKHVARLERERRQTRYILAGFVSILVVVVGILVYGFVDLRYLQPRRPVAEIGETSISISEWQARVRMERRRLINQVQLYQQYQDYLGVDLSSQKQSLIDQLDSGAPLGQSVLDEMIDEEIIRREAAARGISVDEQQVQKAIEESFQYYPDGTLTPTPTTSPIASPTLSAETLALVTITPTPTPLGLSTATATAQAEHQDAPTALAPPQPTETAGPTATPLPSPTAVTRQSFDETYGLTVDQLDEDGLSEAEWRRLYETSLLRRQLQGIVTADVPTTEEQVWARHILLPDEAMAELTRERLEQGGDFANLAATLSTDASNKDRGGDLGWFGRGAMVPEFEAAAFSLKIGEISEPIQTQFGYHIIQVLAHGDVPLDSASLEAARQAAFDAWLADARARYDVLTYDVWTSIVPTEPPLPAAFR